MYWPAPLRGSVYTGLMHSVTHPLHFHELCGFVTYNNIAQLIKRSFIMYCPILLCLSVMAFFCAHGLLVRALSQKYKRQRLYKDWQGGCTQTRQATRINMRGQGHDNRIKDLILHQSNPVSCSSGKLRKTVRYQRDHGLGMGPYFVWGVCEQLPLSSCLPLPPACQNRHPLQHCK